MLIDLMFCAKCYGQPYTPSERDRKMTIMLTPFMSCTAKLPIYAFFAAAFFPKQAGLVMVGLYIFGIVMGIITTLISKRFFI